MQDFPPQSIGLTERRTTGKKEIMGGATRLLHTLSFLFLRSRARSGRREALVSLPGRGATICPNFCSNLRYNFRVFGRRCFVDLYEGIFGEPSFLLHWEG